VSSKDKVTMTVQQFMLHCALLGFQTSDQFRLMVNGFRAGGHNPTIRVTEDSHEWIIDGVVPVGAYVSITKLYMETAEERYAQIAKLHEQFKRACEKSYISPEIGHTPEGIDAITSDGNHVAGVLPCWTAVEICKNQDPTTHGYGEYIQHPVRKLYPIMQVGKTKKVVPAMTRPSMSTKDDCFICSSIAADGSEMRCQEAIDETYAQQVASKEEQIELCYQEQRSQQVRDSLKGSQPNGQYAYHFARELERELEKLFPIEAGIKRARIVATRLQYQIEKTDAAIDYVSKTNVAEIKKANYNPLVAVIGRNIGEKNKKQQIIDKDYALNRLANIRNKHSKDLAKANRLVTLQS